MKLHRNELEASSLARKGNRAPCIEETTEWEKEVARIGRILAKLGSNKKTNSPKEEHFFIYFILYNFQELDVYKDVKEMEILDRCVLGIQEFQRLYLSEARAIRIGSCKLSERFMRKLSVSPENPLLLPLFSDSRLSQIPLSIGVVSHFPYPGLDFSRCNSRD